MTNELLQFCKTQHSITLDKIETIVIGLNCSQDISILTLLLSTETIIPILKLTGI